MHKGSLLSAPCTKQLQRAPARKRYPGHMRVPRTFMRRTECAAWHKLPTRDTPGLCTLPSSAPPADEASTWNLDVPLELCALLPAVRRNDIGDEGTCCSCAWAIEEESWWRKQEQLATPRPQCLSSCRKPREPECAECSASGIRSVLGARNHLQQSRAVVLPNPHGTLLGSRVAFRCKHIKRPGTLIWRAQM